MKKTILISGGAGYIGSIVTEVLINSGYSVIVVDDLSTGNQRAVDKRAFFIKDNFAETNVLRWIFKEYKIDFVIHLAASADISDSVINPCLYYHNNTAQTLSLLHHMVKFGVKNIIFTSSASVYGEPQYTPIDENHPTVPICPYGKSKLMVEEILKDFKSAYGINYVVFRYLNVAGATTSHGESRRNEVYLIPLVMQKALGHSNPLCVYGNTFPTKDGTGVRDYFHVLDVADAHILAMKKMETVTGNVFNLGSQDCYSVLDIINMAEIISGNKIDYKIVAPRPSDASKTLSDCSKAKKLLGWEPKRDLDEILTSAYYWQKNRHY